MRRNDLIAHRLQFVRDPVAYLLVELFDAGFVGRVFQRGHAAELDDDVRVVRHHKGSELIDDFFRRNRITEAHSGQRGDLGEGARDNDLSSFDDVLHGRLIIRIIDEMMVGLVDKYRDVARNAVEQQLDLVLRHNPARRIVRIADVDHAHIARIQLRYADDLFDIGVICFGQRDGDGFGFAVRRKTVDGLVRRLDPNNELVIGQERVIDDLQNLARTATDQDVLGFDVMMFGNGINDAAIRSGVPIAILPGIIHRFHDAFGRAVRVLIVRQLDELVVVLRLFRVRSSLRSHRT